MSKLELDPLVSVIIPTYNMEDSIERSIRSIANQTYSNWEIVIVDDGSKDSIEKQVDELTRGKSNIKYVYQTNRGPGAARNSGITNSMGQLISFLDADDRAQPRKLEIQIRKLRSKKDVAIIGAQSYIATSSGAVRKVTNYPVDDLDIKWLSLFDSPFVLSTVIVRKDVLERAGGFNEDRTFIGTEDYELWSRILEDHSSLNIDEPLLVYLENTKGISHTRRDKQRDQSLQISKNNITRLLSDPAFSLKQARQIRSIRSFSHANSLVKGEDYLKAREDIKKIYQEFHAKNLMNSSTNRSMYIENDFNKMMLIAAYKIGYYVDINVGRRGIWDHFVNRPWSAFSLTFWKTLFKLVRGKRQK